MVLLNRTLNILLVIFAITSLTLGYLLFERRMELRDHGEKLADTVGQVVKVLDKNSGTKLQTDIHRKDFTNSDGQSMLGGTLGWAYFHNSYDAEFGTAVEFSQVLDKVKKQATDVCEQRDSLALTLTEIAALFKQESEPVSAYQDLAKFADAKKTLFENLEKVRQRDDAIIVKIEEVAKKIGVPLDKDALVDLENFEEPLAALGLEAMKVKERMINYSDTLSQAVAKIDSHDFEVNAEMLSDDAAYAGELTAILNDFASINEKLKDYEKYKIELLETKDVLERTNLALESSHDNLAALEDKLANLEQEYASMKTRYNRLIGDTSKPEDSRLQKLEGTVLDVDYDWNYVVLNLGSKDNLPENLEMTIAREQEYICKVLVTRVYKNFSVAEILPKLKEGNVIEGDRVIF